MNRPAPDPDTPFDQLEFAAIDFESSGYGPDGKDEPIQIGIAILRGGRVEPGAALRSYLAPTSPRPISDAAYAVHRIGDAQLTGAPPLAELWPALRDRLAGRIVVAHGAGTEKRFLRAFPMHGFGPWLDTLAVARMAMPDAASHALGPLLDQSGLTAPLRALCPPPLDWHDALFDATASLLLLRHLCESLSILDAPLARLDHRARR